MKARVADKAPGLCFVFISPLHCLCVGFVLLFFTSPLSLDLFQQVRQVIVAAVVNHQPPAFLGRLDLHLGA